MKPYIIFLDIDGTLVYKNKISNVVQEAIHKARENGHYVFLCTGRSIMGVSSIPKIELDGAIISAGGYITIQDQVIFHTSMKEELVQKSIEIFNTYKILYTLEGDYASYTDIEKAGNMYKAIMPGIDNSEWERMKNEFLQVMNLKPLEEYETNKVPIQTICFYVEENLLQEIKTIFEKNFDFIIHGKTDNLYNCEINRKDADKGKGIQMVCDYLQIPLARTIGFGDGMNDLSMIQTCGIGIAMGNAHEDLKRQANRICESVQNDGIAHELKRLKLI